MRLSLVSARSSLILRSLRRECTEGVAKDGPQTRMSVIERFGEFEMQTQSPFFDEIARLMTEAAGAADGVRREAETMFRGELQRLIADMDFVTREEFEAVRDMARAAREENESLKARLAALEGRLGKTS